MEIQKPADFCQWHSLNKVFTFSSIKYATAANGNTNKNLQRKNINFNVKILENIIV